MMQTTPFVLFQLGSFLFFFSAKYLIGGKHIEGGPLCSCTCKTKSKHKKIIFKKWPFKKIDIISQNYPHDCVFFWQQIEGCASRNIICRILNKK